MNNTSNTTLDFSHVIRDRLTSIALCANLLESAFKPELSAEQQRAFGIIQWSVSDIKLVLDQLATCYHAEVTASRKYLARSEMFGAAVTPTMLPDLPRAEQNQRRP